MSPNHSFSHASIVVAVVLHATTSYKMVAVVLHATTEAIGSSRNSICHMSRAREVAWSTFSSTMTEEFLSHSSPFYL